MKTLIKDSRAIGKVTLTFTSLIVGLCITVIFISVVMSSQINSLQSTNKQLQSEYDALQSQYDQLNTQYQQLQSSQSTSQTPQTVSLQNQIASLQAQLSSAKDTIAQLQGQTGILPTYMDLGYSGNNYAGSYFLQLSLKNTGTVPITQVYVTLNSGLIDMPLTYLNNTVSASSPLPSYQIATGRFQSSIGSIGTYPLVIQALTNNGTIYTYQTTINAHI